MFYTVIVSEPAESDIQGIYFRLMIEFPDFAGKWYDGMLTALSTLETFPQRCPLAPENDGFPDAQVRQLLYRHGRHVSRILYSIHDPDTVKILYVRGGGYTGL